MNCSNIAASLKYGNIISKKQTVALYIVIIFNFATPLFMIFFAIICMLNGEIGMSIIIIVIALGFLILLCLLIKIPYSNKKLKKKILPWLDDVVEINAKSIVIDKNWNGLLQPSYYKIKVIFYFDGKKFIHISGDENSHKGYHKIFRAYANREIKILYSPKYDEVLILKDKV